MYHQGWTYGWTICLFLSLLSVCACWLCQLAQQSHWTGWAVSTLNTRGHAKAIESFYSFACVNKWFRTSLDSFDNNGYFHIRHILCHQPKSCIRMRYALASSSWSLGIFFASSHHPLSGSALGFVTPNYYYNIQKSLEYWNTHQVLG